MARLPRVVLPGIPHHVTQRSNGQQQTFFEDGDYALYLDLLASAAERAQVQVWSYCLMPNHVHVILCPQDEDGLWRTFGDLHRRYTGFINARHRTTGHLWQGRFGSVAMDEAHFVTALRYVALNPVRARLVERAQDWRSRRRSADRKRTLAGMPGTAYRPDTIKRACQPLRVQSSASSRVATA